jgi:hypothetical protein
MQSQSIDIPVTPQASPQTSPQGSPRADPETPRASTPQDNHQTRPLFEGSRFRETCIDIITPAIETDVRDMVRGRVLWRRISTVFEVFGRLSGATGTVIAFAGGSDITGETVSRALAFSAGCLGTTSMVSTLFASFSRQQSLERSTAINKILETVHVDAIPDVAKALDIQGTNND